MHKFENKRCIAQVYVADSKHLMVNKPPTPPPLPKKKKKNQRNLLVTSGSLLGQTFPSKLLNRTVRCTKPNAELPRVSKWFQHAAFKRASCMSCYFRVLWGYL